MDLGYAIKLVRRELDLTQTELSDMAGISQTALCQIEKGSKRPSPKTIEKICKAAQIPESLLYILGMRETEVPESKKQIYKLVFPAIQGLAMQIVCAEHEVFAMAG
jgi:transcriptional regulator with XRE-family HTH domain